MHLRYLDLVVKKSLPCYILVRNVAMAKVTNSWWSILPLATTHVFPQGSSRLNGGGTFSVIAKVLFVWVGLLHL
jgi:hypothetical protein